MSKKSIGHKKLVSQCLSLLPTEEFECPLLNYEYDKLKTDALFKVFVVAQLKKCESYGEIEEIIRMDKGFQEQLNLKSISASQLSRRINVLPTEWAQAFFLRTVQMLKDLTKNEKGVSPEIGRLKVLDSTHLKLPPNLCDWAYVSKGWNVVKMHTRLVIVSDETSFPDKIIPSTGNVGDSEAAKYLVEKTDATYVMDRGYPSNENLYKWIKDNIRFVVRISSAYKFVAEENHEITNPNVIRDCKVQVYYKKDKRPARLLEFKDKDGVLYRLLTTRWDLTAEQIMDIYRYRWTIELFFKWIKQHLRFVKIWSHNPQGIWNQMFLALSAYCLALIILIQSKTKLTLWEVVSKIKMYMFRTYSAFMRRLNPKKSKTSKGRQKVPIPKPKDEVFKGSVALIKPQENK